MATIANIKESKTIEVANLSFTYANTAQSSLKNIDMPIAKNKITALIGPSGCGKTTLLRCFNRIHDLYAGNVYKGKIIFNNQNILESKTDLIDLRTKIGMIFQKPTSFPMSIWDNIAYGLKLKGIKSKSELNGR
ncbi:MAG: ATP-binding cassette domain-containing protein, partial [Campylobacteraceae bacterium]|nr:ATP-binding cassette domain-containing protein [Campylobacteraceae bacterium]